MMECWRNGVLEARRDNLRASRFPTASSPSPQPSPLRRGSRLGQTRTNSTRIDYSRDGRQSPLSLRERVGVRGNRRYLRQVVPNFEKRPEHGRIKTWVCYSTPLLNCSITAFLLGGA